MNIHEALSPARYNSLWKTNWLNNLCRYSLLPNADIGWNYLVDYPWMIEKFEMVLNDLPKDKALKVVDIGCGPGAVHGFLEEKHGIDIIGIDLKRWDAGDYVDYVGNFSDINFRNAQSLKDIDVIISTSAFEHNSPIAHYRLVRDCMSSLSDNGYLITTSSISANGKTNNTPRTQFNLGVNDLKIVYGTAPQNSDHLTEIDHQWQNDKTLMTRFNKRYGKHTKREYVSYGVVMKKQDLPTKASDSVKLKVIGGVQKILGRFK
ncbi:class I SAM-dependent methyltransferase [Planktomarina temperata]|nr:class I SAM-dependent methyltransferase [Planktomarina temperata]